MASKLKQLQSKAGQASQVLSKHGTAYYKQLMEQNKQYVQEPATVEKCNELSKQLFYTRLASIKVARKMQSLKDIMPAARNNINTQFIVLEKGRTTLEGGQNKTCLGLVADEAASVHFQFWNEECDAFQPGDIVRVSNGIFSYNRNNHLVLRAGKRGKLEKVGEFTMAFVELPNMSEILWVLDLNKPGTYIQESVISPCSRIFPPMV